MAERCRLPTRRENLTRTLAVWGVVTGIIVTMVLNYVLPWVISRSSTAFVAYHYAIGPGLLILVGVYVERRSNRPWIVAFGTVFLLWAAMTLALGCPGSACPKPEEYQYWRHIKLTVDIGNSRRNDGPVFSCVKINFEPSQVLSRLSTE